MTLSYTKKYYIALTIAIIGGLLVASGASTLSGSFGIAQIIREGLIQLVAGLILFIPSAPMVHYFKSRKSQKLDRTKLEIDALLEQQDEKDKKPN